MQGDAFEALKDQPAKRFVLRWSRTFMFAWSSFLAACTLIFFLGGVGYLSDGNYWMGASLTAVSAPFVVICVAGVLRSLRGSSVEFRDSEIVIREIARTR